MNRPSSPALPGISALLLAASTTAAAADLPATPPGGAAVVIDAPGGFDPVGLLADGRLAVLVVAAGDGARSDLHARIAAAGRLGLAAVETAADLSHLPAADHLATLVVVEDGPAALARGLTADEVQRICAEHGTILVGGAVAGAAFAGLAGERVGAWLRIRPALPGGSGESPIPGLIDGAGSRIVDDRLAARRNYFSNWTFPEADQPGSWEAGRSSAWPRWIDGLHANRTGKSTVQALAVADGATAQISQDDVVAWVRDGLWFLDRKPAVLACRDSATGIPRWAEPTQSKTLAIHDRAVWTLEPQRDGTALVARSLADGAQRTSTVLRSRSLRHLIAAEGVVVAGGEGVHAVDAATGALRWTWPGGEVISVLVRPDLVVVAAGPPPEKGKPAQADRLVALDARTGAERWTRPAAEIGGATDLRTLVGPVAVAVGNDSLVAIRLADGGVQFQEALAKVVGDRLPWLVAQADGRIVVADARGTRLLDPSTGAPASTNQRALLSGYGKWMCAPTGALTTGLLQQAFGAPATPPLPPPLGSQHIASSCRVGSVVAYRTAYVPMQGCACYGGRTPGFVAAQEVARPPAPERFARPGVLEPGDAPPSAAAADAPGGWTAWRADAARSQASTTPAPAAAALRWRRQLAQPLPPGPIAEQSWRGQWLSTGRITQPVSAGGLAVVALPDQHQVVAVALADGSERWRFTADGPLDGPPSLHRGRAVFGCRDGRVYALDLATGRLAWRRRLVDLDERIAIYGQLESRFPVTGPVVAQDGIVHATAGMLGEIGIAYAALDLADGAVRTWRWLPRARLLNDALVADAGGRLWLGFVPLDGPAPEQQKIKPREPSMLPSIDGLAKNARLDHLVARDGRLLGRLRTGSPTGPVPSVQDGPVKNGRAAWKALTAYADGSPVLQRGSVERLSVADRSLGGVSALDWTWDGTGQVGIRSDPSRRVPLPPDPAHPLTAVRFGEIFAIPPQDPGKPVERLLWRRWIGEAWAVALAADAVAVAGPVVPPSVPAEARFRDWGAKPTIIDPVTAPGHLTLLDRTSGEVRQRLELPAAPVQEGIACIAEGILIAGADGSLMLAAGGR